MIYAFLAFTERFTATRRHHMNIGIGRRARNPGRKFKYRREKLQALFILLMPTYSPFYLRCTAELSARASPYYKFPCYGAANTARRR